jgi:hypothetical protein
MRNDSLKIMKLEDGPFAILTEKQKEVIDLPMTELPIKQKEKPYFIGSFGFDTKNIITLREWFMINNTVGSKKVICCRPDQAEFFSKKHPLMTYATHF